METPQDGPYEIWDKSGMRGCCDSARTAMLAVEALEREEPGTEFTILKLAYPES